MAAWLLFEVETFGWHALCTWLGHSGHVSKGMEVASREASGRRRFDHWDVGESVILVGSKDIAITRYHCQKIWLGVRMYMVNMNSMCCGIVLTRSGLAYRSSIFVHL